MKGKYFQIAQKDTVADVYIFGDLCEWPWPELGEQSAKSLLDQINELDAEVINVHIDSFGGSVKEGWGLYNALRNHKATVNTYADGFVASAALYPFLAGQKRLASPVAAFYLHEMMSGQYGYAEDLKKAAEELEKLTQIGVQAFVEVTGQSQEKILELMKAETWLDPQEALELGIVTEMVKEETQQRLTQCVRDAVMKRLTQKAKEPEPKRNLVLEMLSK